jgi:hypothetical protein
MFKVGASENGHLCRKVSETDARGLYRLRTQEEKETDYFLCFEEIKWHGK